MATLVVIIGTSFTTPGCLEPVDLAKNLAQNRIISISAANSGFFFKHAYFEY